MSGPKLSAKPGAQAERPACERGDHIYFRNPKGKPFKGRVLAHGEHGCTVHHPETKTRHKVRWEQYLGHAQRVQPALRVLEQGEDGFIAEDVTSGKVRYVHDPMTEGDGESSPLLKSLMMAARPGRLVGGKTAIERLVALKRAEVTPLMKALKGAPGLSLQDVTTKAGGRTKRWKRTAPKEKAGKDGAKPELPPAHRDAAAGDQVHFKAGAFEGKGEVVAHGAKGAHVRDETGRLHKVDWSEVQERQKPSAGGGGGGDEKVERQLPEDHEKHFNTEGASKLKVSNLRRTKDAEQDGGEKREGELHDAREGKKPKRDPIKVTANEDGTHSIKDGHASHTVVSKHGWDHVPAHVVQPQGAPEEIFAAGREAVEHLKTWLNKGSGLCDQMGFQTMSKAPEDVAEAEWGRPGGMLFIAPVKSVERAREKVMADYGGDWSRLKDVARCTLAVDTIEDMRSAITKLQAAGMIVAQPPKDRYAGKPTPQGYRDVNMTVRAPNGHLMEIQFNTKAMLRAKVEGHKLYETTRSLEAKYGDRAPVDWPDADQKAYFDADDAQGRLYNEAFEKLQPKS